MKKVTYTIEGTIGQIIIDDGKVNALNPPLFDEMGKAINRVLEGGAKALVIAGRPGCFSAGLDIKLLPNLSPVAHANMSDAFAHTMTRIFLLPIPTVAACTGHAIAGGLMLALSCDLRFALDGAFRLQMNEVANNMTLPGWMLLIGRSGIPVQYHVEALLHAHAYTPKEAFERGIISGLVSGENNDVIARAKTAAEELLALDQDCYAITKKRMRAKEVAHALQLIPEERKERKE